MRLKQLAITVALYTGVPLLGLAAGLLVTFIFAWFIDPQGSGPVGEGLLFLVVSLITVPSGIAVGSGFAWVLSSRIRTREKGT